MHTIKRIIKRTLITLLSLVLVVAFSMCGINGYVLLRTADRILTVEEAALLHADCILVLGASVRPGGIPSDMLRDRLDTAIALYNAGASDRLLMSGDHAGQYYDEVSAMKAYAMDAGVSSKVIFLDHAGFSTYESMYRAKEIFGAEKIVIVTQEYHLYRAIYNATALGLDAYGVAVKETDYQNMDQNYRREFLARNKDFFYCIAKPEPTELGDPIPLSGNGDDTNAR